jgi:hypothetical protein
VKLNELIKEGECDTAKLKPLKFTIGKLVYEIPPAHYLKKTVKLKMAIKFKVDIFRKKTM